VWFCCTDDELPATKTRLEGMLERGAIQK